MYKAYITKIKNIRKHPNADRLLLGNCFNSTVIVDLKTKEGDIGIYFPTDGQLGEEYAKVNNLVRLKDENGDNIGGYLDANKRNIRAIKLRSEQSDGLFMPLSSLSSFIDIEKLEVGQAIDKIDDVVICQKYVPIKPKRNNQQTKVTKSLFPNFQEHTDTSQLAYNLNSFTKGDLCHITLKLHGTSQRTGYLSKKVKKNLFVRTLEYLTKKKFTRDYDYVTGSRRVELSNLNEGYRFDVATLFNGKLNKGETVFYEIVGYEDSGATIMPVCQNKKVQDKEFVKQFGKTTTFKYGCEPFKHDVYIYRITMTTEEGFVIEYPFEMVKLRAEQMGIKTVPLLDKFIFTTKEDLEERVARHIEGADLIDSSHIREGVVVIKENGSNKFEAYKDKNFYFKVIEGIIKDEGIVDTEELESLSQGDEQYV